MMARVEKLRELMKENNLQGFLVTSPYNLRYLTNFTGTTGLAMITLDKAFFVIRNKLRNKQLVLLSLKTQDIFLTK